MGDNGIQNSPVCKPLLRDRELTQLMTHHVLRYHYWDIVFAVVYEKSEPVERQAY